MHQTNKCKPTFLDVPVDTDIAEIKPIILLSIQGPLPRFGAIWGGSETENSNSTGQQHGRTVDASRPTEPGICPWNSLVVPQLKILRLDI